MCCYEFAHNNILKCVLGQTVIKLLLKPWLLSLQLIYFCICNQCFFFLPCRFLLESLEDLDTSLRKLNSRLFVVRGQPADVFPRLFKVSLWTWSFQEESEAFLKTRLSRNPGLLLNIWFYNDNTMRFIAVCVFVQTCA